MSSAAARPQHEQPAVDPEALARLERFGGQALLREMATLYLASAPERIAAVEAALAADDVVAAEYALHSLKSSSAQLGALRLARLCEAGEQITRGGRLAGVTDVVEAGRAELARVTAWLTDALERRSA
jgi:HPt (histidine-containing phosphotransfer) domain-containing protein